MIAMGDCAINIDPNEDETGGDRLPRSHTVRRGHSASSRALLYLSYSTMGSGKGPTVDMMRNAAKRRVKELEPERKVSDGELQFDAAVAPR